MSYKNHSTFDLNKFPAANTTAATEPIQTTTSPVNTTAAQPKTTTTTSTTTTTTTTIKPESIPEVQPTEAPVVQAIQPEASYIHPIFVPAMPDGMFMPNEMNFNGEYSEQINGN